MERCYFTEIEWESNVTKFSIQGFCDASTKAYAAVLCLRMEMASGSCMRFLASKTRVAPVASQTVSRLELLTALLLVRLVISVTSAIKSKLMLSEPTCFTDSKVALC